MNKHTLIFASNNQHKIEEINSIIGNQFNVISLKDAGINIDIPEPHDTIEANASEKSITIYKLTKQNCFGDDTGLEVNFLNGEPGVKSARYAGEEKNFEANIDKLLNKLKNSSDRSAQFKTIISLMWNGKEFLFEGIVKGNITKERKGTGGFGYDAVFVPEGETRTFAEMKPDEKNKNSHRAKALKKLTAYLKEQ